MAMLAAHREQENRVLGHQIPSKQHPKTPGMRYPKTPMELGRGNENALAGLAAKNTIQGAVNLGRNENFISKKPLLTPTESRMRAPLGNKTTNAKAQGNLGHRIGGKGAVKGIEKTQSKNAATQKRKQKKRQRRAELAPKNLIFNLRDGHYPDGDEPEYAPPNPQPLPYQSDVFPRSGLTLKGLSKETLLRGYFEHFYNPVDDDGISRVEKQLEDEMKTTIEEAIRRNERDTEEFNWNSIDVPDELEISERMTRQKKRLMLSAEKRTQDASLRPPTPVTRASRSGLSMAKPLVSANQESHESRIITRSSRQRAADSAVEAPSLSTTTYARESSTSLVLRGRGEIAVDRPTRALAAVSDRFDPTEPAPADLVAQLYQNVSSDEIASDTLAHLQFRTDSDGEDLNENIPLCGMSCKDSEDEGEFELGLDI